MCKLFEYSEYDALTVTTMFSSTIHDPLIKVKIYAYMTHFVGFIVQFPFLGYNEVQNLVGYDEGSENKDICVYVCILYVITKKKVVIILDTKFND